MEIVRNHNQASLVPYSNGDQYLTIISEATGWTCSGGRINEHSVVRPVHVLLFKINFFKK
jgi:hypothetical protein